MAINNVILALNKNARSRDVVTAAYYKCPTANKTIATNNFQSPLSPFGGGEMKKISKKVISIPVKDIKTQMVKAGTCPCCESDWYITVSAAKTLKKIGPTPFNCVLCYTEYTAQCDKIPASAIQAETNNNATVDTQVADAPDDTSLEEDDMQVVSAADNDDDSENDSDGDENDQDGDADDEDDEDDDEDDEGNNNEEDGNKEESNTNDNKSNGKSTPLASKRGEYASPPRVSNSTKELYTEMLDKLLPNSSRH